MIQNRTFLLAGLSFIMLLLMISGCENEETINYKRYYVNGKGLYEKNCQGCHGQNGEGFEKLYPPLTDSSYLKDHKNLLACIIRNGQNEVITINGVKFDTQMPGNSTLANIEVAQIIVYISNSFGNKQGFYSLDQTTNDLNQCP